MVALHGDQEARFEHFGHDGFERVRGGRVAVCGCSGGGGAVGFGFGGAVGGDEVCDFGVAELEHVGYDQCALRRRRRRRGGLLVICGRSSSSSSYGLVQGEVGRYIIAKLRLHGTDNTAGVKQLVDLQPLALVVDDIAVVLRVGVVGDEVLLDEDHEGLLDDFGVELDVVADLGDGQTAELEEDRDDFLERVSCVLL